MLPHDVLAGQEADDMPQAAVGPRTVSGYPVSHRSPLASSYAAVITVRGLRTPSTGWNLPTAVQTAPTSTGAVRVHVGSIRPGRSAPGPTVTGLTIDAPCRPARVLRGGAASDPVVDGAAAGQGRLAGRLDRLGVPAMTAIFGLLLIVTTLAGRVRPWLTRA